MMRFFFGFILAVVIAGGSGSPVSAQTDEPNVAMFLCFGVNRPGDRDTRNRFVIAAEQTNADEQDGAILLRESIYERAVFGGMRPMRFRVRVFQDGRDHIIEGTPEEEVVHLLSDAIPQEAYDEYTDTYATISFQSFSIQWVPTGNHRYDFDLNYKPSNKTEEFFIDRNTGAFRSVW